ncbi:5-oxoprolinase [Moniliophthora roreri]|nr:5-oxoprolinase [Moniliophthora roreri]
MNAHHHRIELCRNLRFCTIALGMRTSHHILNYMGNVTGTHRRVRRENTVRSPLEWLS